MAQVQLPIGAHQKDDASRSILKRAVGSIGTAFVKEGVSPHLQSEIAHYGSQFLKTGALCMRGKLGLAGTMILYGLDQIRPGDSAKEIFVDAIMGATKGALMKGTFHWLGSKPVGVAAKGIGLGVGSRVLDIGLTRQTYLDGQTGQFSFKKGLSEIVSGSLNKPALATDVVVFGFAHGLFGGANRLSGGAIEKSPLLKTMFTSTTFGISAGAGGEIMRQNAEGERFDLGKVIKRGLIQGGLDTFAAVPGGVQADRLVQGRLHSYVRTGIDRLENRVEALKTSFIKLADSFSIDGRLVLAPAGGPAGMPMGDFEPGPTRTRKQVVQLYLEPLDPAKLPAGSAGKSDKIIETQEPAQPATHRSETPPETASGSKGEDVLSKQAIHEGRQFDVVGLDASSGEAILRDPRVNVDQSPLYVMKLSENTIANHRFKQMLVGGDEYYYNQGEVWKVAQGRTSLEFQPEMKAVRRGQFRLPGAPLDVQRPVSSQELAELNPGRRIEVGERYTLRNSSGAIEESWLLEGNTLDGTLIVSKEGAIYPARANSSRLVVVTADRVPAGPGELTSEQIAMRNAPFGLEDQVLHRPWFRGRIEAPDGSYREVIFRTKPDHKAETPNAAGRLKKELIAYQLNHLFGFDNGFPVTVEREVLIDGVMKKGWMQDHAGQPFEKRLREMAKQRIGSDDDDAVSRLVSEDAHLRKQVEQAFVERLIYGDSDDHAGNFVIVETPSGPKVQNIDVEFAFEARRKPKWNAETPDEPLDCINERLHADFSEKPISEDTLSKIQGFLKKYDTRAGRQHLAQLGLESKQISDLLTRARWLANGRKFPRSETAFRIQPPGGGDRS